MAGLDFDCRYFFDPPGRKRRRYLAEYLIEYRRRGDDDSGKQVVYKLDHVTPGYVNIVTRLATHSDKVRLHEYRHTETLTMVRSSPMNNLHAALALAIYRQDRGCPDGFNRKEWKENLLRAKDLISRRKLATSDLGDITGAIIPRRREKNWRKQLCGWCHTPLLIGYSLNGHKITRAKRFCSDACKMNQQRFLARRRRRQGLTEATSVI
jgi:hypothetical protein